MIRSYGSVPYGVNVQSHSAVLTSHYSTYCVLASGRETIVTINQQVNRQKENNNPDFLQPNYIHVGFQGTV